MRIPLPCKLAAVAVLGVGTVFATKAILAAGGAKPTRAAAPRETIAITSSVAGPDYRPPRPLPGGGIIGRCGIKSAEYRTIGGTIHVTAEAVVSDRRPVPYVWSFRLFDPTDEGREDPLYQKIYDDQLFTPQQLQAPPTFEDAIRPPLPPGKYLAEIALSQPHPELGLEAVRDPGRYRVLRKAAKCRVITIE